MYYTEYTSPLGVLTLCSDGEAITGLYLPGQKFSPKDQTKKDDLKVFRMAEQWLDRYFAGENPESQIPVRPEGTAFQRRVWNLLAQVPYGKTVTYGQLARKISPNMSSQAVGGAVGRNPVSILIPCHRCLGAGGALTGYAGGLEAKRYLLQLEEQNHDGK